MEVEKTFDAFVRDFGGELVSELFVDRASKPQNADYFFGSRSIVAELKCVEKDYSTDPEVGNKTNLLIQKWLQAGLIRPEHGILTGNGNLRFETKDLPEPCAAEMFKLFVSPVEKLVTKANKQIKVTKQHFDLPEAQGLLILAVDGNYSMNPNMIIHALAHLLKNQHTGIDSFICFTPNMRLTTPEVDRQFQFWSSGSARPSANAVEPEYLDQIYQGWASFLEKTTGEEVTQIDNIGQNAIRTMRYIQE